VAYARSDGSSLVVLHGGAAFDAARRCGVGFANPAVPDDRFTAGAAALGPRRSSSGSWSSSPSSGALVRNECGPRGPQALEGSL